MKSRRDKLKIPSLTLDLSPTCQSPTLLSPCSPCSPCSPLQTLHPWSAVSHTLDHLAWSGFSWLGASVGQRTGGCIGSSAAVRTEQHAADRMNTKGTPEKKRRWWGQQQQQQ
ncbi:hypothetical protein ATANTOWER_021517 [Ataeniobius toweri]|uniref:Uncharacterized protein n=1 Tax=Ataeniobius toweri TaxID=208326 RepID=A0ABU7AW61_9TELE|nr:hypothetical protein [Ataeniobius toweri]